MVGKYHNVLQRKAIHLSFQFLFVESELPGQGQVKSRESRFVPSSVANEQIDNLLPLLLCPFVLSLWQQQRVTLKVKRLCQQHLSMVFALLSLSLFTEQATTSFQ